MSQLQGFVWLQLNCCIQELIIKNTVTHCNCKESSNKSNNQLQPSKVVKGLEVPVYETHKELDTYNLPKLASTC